MQWHCCDKGRESRASCVRIVCALHSELTLLTKPTGGSYRWNRWTGRAKEQHAFPYKTPSVRALTSQNRGPRQPKAGHAGASQTIYNSKWLTGFRNTASLFGIHVLKCSKTFFLCRKRAKERRREARVSALAILVGEDWLC